MEDTADDLSTPLGQETVRRKRRFRLPFTAMQGLAVLLGLFLATFAGFALFSDNPLGGEPTARVVLRQQPQEAPRPHPARRAPKPGPPPSSLPPAPSKRPSRSSMARAARARLS